MRFLPSIAGGFLAAAVLYFVSAFDALPQGTQLWEYGTRGYLCDSHKIMEDRYTGPPHNEKLMWWAINADGNSIFGYVAVDGSWTVLRVRPDGVSCMVGHGSDWTLMLGKESNAL